MDGVIFTTAKHMPDTQKPPALVEHFTPCVEVSKKEAEIS